MTEPVAAQRTRGLTRHLDDRSSPVRAWFEKRLPATAAVARDANHALHGPTGQRDGRNITLGRPTRAPLASIARNQQLAGTALDLLARATLQPGALAHSAAALGAGSIVVGAGIPPAMQIEREAVAALLALEPWRVALDSAGCKRLAELCLLLARFEQASRSYDAIQYAIDRVRSAPPTLGGYVAALVDEADLADVAAVAPAVAADHADLRAARRLCCGPSFALSAQLGGADADVVADGLLLDFKASSCNSVVKRRELWQLTGYALADRDDDFEIQTVGVSALRWRRRWTISLAELLERLAATALAFDAARAEFAQVCALVAPRRPWRR